MTRIHRAKGTRALTLADLKRAAAKYGASVEDDSAPPEYTYQVVAPVGRCWEPELHDLLVRLGRHPRPEDRHEVIAEGIRRMEGYGGTQECAADCDCRDE